MQTSNSSKNKQKILATRKIIEFSCYIKLEKNGIEVKSKLMQSNTIGYLGIYEHKFENGNQPPILTEVLEIRNKNKDLVFFFNKQNIIRIIDKFIYEGKLTILISKDKDKFSIFISKSTKELIDAFINKLNGNRSEESNNTVSNTISTNISKVPSNINRKRKFHELLKEKQNQLHNLPGKAAKQLPSHQMMNITLKNEHRYKFEDFPDYLYFIIFEFLDKRTIMTKVSLINRELKGISDNYVEKLTIRDDTPSQIFNKLLVRFKKIKTLVFGKAKNFKNEIIKNLDTTLKNLECLDMSQVQNLNDTMIKRLFSKTNVKRLTTLKMNYYLESLCIGYYYILDFYTNLKTLEIINYSFDHTSIKSLNQIAKFPRYYCSLLFKPLIQILLSDRHSLSQLHIFLFNAYIDTIPKDKCIFSKLTHLTINLLLIEKVKQLQIFYNCSNLIQFSIDSIAIKDTSTRSTEPNFVYADFANTIIPEGNDNNMEIDEQVLEILSIDFENDYLEVFGKIFYFMKDNLKYLTLGSFVTDDLCKYISIYLKNLRYVSFSSDKVTDNGIKVIMSECKEINEVNFDGCTRIWGSFFFDLGDQIQNLKKATLSIQTYNYYHVINYLKGRGIEAENYIRANPHN